MARERSGEAAVLEGVVIRRRPSPIGNIVRFIRIKPLGAVGGFIFLAIVAAALVAPYIAPHDPYEVNTTMIFKPPSTQFLLGTDSHGRDILSRIIWGSRISLCVGILAAAIGTTTGTILGAVSAYYGGKVDLIIQRIIDSLMAFPALILALTIMAALGQSLNNVVIALSIIAIPAASRTVRSVALSIKETQYIEAAKAIGCADRRVISLHILPNCAAPYLIMVAYQVGRAILTEASLSFLGVGIPPPEPSWGGMLVGGAQQYLQLAPWAAFFPGIAISLAVFSSNILGDALRDFLDPRLRGTQ